MMKQDETDRIGAPAGESQLSNEADNAGWNGKQRLQQAIRQAKAAQADRLDSVTDIRQADIGRLELLVQDLQPVFDAVPEQDEQWDFCLNHGMQPRLWLDASAFVMIGRDRRSYHFVRDTRLGRMTLAETADLKLLSAAVTRYIAMRMIERERLMDDLEPLHMKAQQQDSAAVAPSPAGVPVQPADLDHSAPKLSHGLISGLLWFAGGALLGCAVLALIYHYYGLSLPVLR